MLKIAEIREILRPVVFDIMGTESVKDVEVYEGFSSIGDKIIMINVWINGNNNSYNPKKALETSRLVNQKLYEAGDERFVSMLPVFAGDEPGENDGPIPDGEISAD